MVDAGQQRAIELAVADDAAHRDAAEPDAVVAPLAADQPGAAAVAPDIVVGQRDLERGVHRLRSRIGEEHVVEVARRQRGDAACRLERLGVAELERRGIVEHARLFADGLDDGGAVVAGIAAPQAGGAVDDAAAVGGEVVEPVGADDHPRRGLEGAIGRERHPEGVEVVGRGGAGGRSGHRGSWRLVRIRRHTGTAARACQNTSNGHQPALVQGGSARFRLLAGTANGFFTLFGQGDPSRRQTRAPSVQIVLVEGSPGHADHSKGLDGAPARPCG